MFDTVISNEEQMVSGIEWRSKVKIKKKKKVGRLSRK